MIVVALSRRNVVRSVVAVAATASLAVSVAPVAQGQAALGSLSSIFGGNTGDATGKTESSLGGALGSLSGEGLPEFAGEKKLAGTIDGPLRDWQVGVYTQLPNASGEVAPGGKITLRLELVGHKSTPRIGEIGMFVPADFKLVKITRMKDGLLGTSPSDVLSGGYTDLIQNGRREVRLSWKDGLLFKSEPQVSQSQSVVVDFTFEAPQSEGSFPFSVFTKATSPSDPAFWFSRQGEFRSPQNVTVKRNSTAAGSFGGATGSSGDSSGSFASLSS